MTGPIVTCASGNNSFTAYASKMRSGMADDFHAFGILVGDDASAGILLDQMRGIHQLAVHLAGQRGTSQTAPMLSATSATVLLRKAALRTIGKVITGIFSLPKNTKCGDAARRTCPSNTAGAIQRIYRCPRTAHYSATGRIYNSFRAPGTL